MKGYRFYDSNILGVMMATIEINKNDEKLKEHATSEKEDYENLRLAFDYYSPEEFKRIFIDRDKKEKTVKS